LQSFGAIELQVQKFNWWSYHSNLQVVLSNTHQKKKKKLC